MSKYDCNTLICLTSSAKERQIETQSQSQSASSEVVSSTRSQRCLVNSAYFAVMNSMNPHQHPSPLLLHICTSHDHTIHSTKITIFFYLLFNNTQYTVK